MTHAKFHFNRLMLTLIFGIWASEPPFGPGERLKRPGLMGLMCRKDSLESKKKPKCLCSSRVTTSFPLKIMGG